MIKNKTFLSLLVASILLSTGFLFSASLSYAKPRSTTIVPLYFGENRGSRGENLPIQENHKKIFSFIEKDLNIQFQFRFFPWNRAVKMASIEGGLIYGLSSTPEREKIFNFSVPATYNNIWLITRSDKIFEFHSLDDLKGKTIGIVRGSKYGGEFDVKLGKLFKTDDDLDSYDNRLRKLLEGRIDAMLYASSSDNHKEVEIAVNQIELSKLKTTSANRFSVLPTPLLKNDLRFAILKGTNDELIEKINLSLEKFKSITRESSKSTSHKPTNNKPIKK